VTALSALTRIIGSSTGINQPQIIPLTSCSRPRNRTFVPLNIDNVTGIIQSGPQIRRLPTPIRFEMGDEYGSLGVAPSAVKTWSIIYMCEDDF